MFDDRFIDARLLTQDALHRLGESFVEAWPLNRSSTFDGLLQEIDEADGELRREPKIGEMAFSESRTGMDADREGHSLG